METSDFESFYRDSCDECYRALIVVTGDPGEADELLAEAFTRALEHWSEVRNHPAPKAWVITVATNLKRDRWRRARRALRVFVGTPTMVQDPDPPMDPRLMTLISSLSDQQRTALAYRIMLDLDTAITADLMGVTAGTVTTHLHRALSSLRQQLDNYEVQP